MSDQVYIGQILHFLKNIVLDLTLARVIEIQLQIFGQPVRRVGVDSVTSDSPVTDVTSPRGWLDLSGESHLLRGAVKKATKSEYFICVSQDPKMVPILAPKQQNFHIFINTLSQQLITAVGFKNPELQR